MSIPYTSNKYGQGYIRECYKCNKIFIYKTPQALGLAWSNHTRGVSNKNIDRKFSEHYDSNKRPDQPVIVTDKERR